MDNITLYYVPTSAPCRAVLLTGAALNIHFDLKDLTTTILSKRQKSDELLKINPNHTVPAIMDGEFSLWDCRIISTYLAEKYDKRVEFNLYPDLPEIRAIIRQRLYSDLKLFWDLHANSDDQAYFPKIERAFRNFNTILKARDKLGEENLYSAADWLTIADLALAAIVTNFVFDGFHIESYPFVEKWYNTVNKVPYFQEANNST